MHEINKEVRKSVTKFLFGTVLAILLAAVILFVSNDCSGQNEHTPDGANLKQVLEKLGSNKMTERDRYFLKGYLDNLKLKTCGCKDEESPCLGVFDLITAVCFAILLTTILLLNWNKKFQFDSSEEELY